MIRVTIIVEDAPDERLEVTESGPSRTMAERPYSGLQDTLQAAAARIQAAAGADA